MRCLCFTPIGNGIAIAGAALEVLGIGGKLVSVPCSAFQDQATSLVRLARVHLVKVHDGLIQRGLWIIDIACHGSILDVYGVFIAFMWPHRLRSWAR